MGHKSEDCWSLGKNKENFETFKEKFWNVKCYVCGENPMVKDCQKRFRWEAANDEKEYARKAFHL